MGFVVLAVGALMSASGIYFMYVGNMNILVERGWSAFISGAALLSGGVITIALGFAIRAIEGVRTALAGGLVSGLAGGPAAAAFAPARLEPATAMPIAAAPPEPLPAFVDSLQPAAVPYPAELVAHDGHRPDLDGAEDGHSAPAPHPEAIAPAVGDLAEPAAVAPSHTPFHAAHDRDARDDVSFLASLERDVAGEPHAPEPVHAAAEPDPSPAAAPSFAAPAFETSPPEPEPAHHPEPQAHEPASEVDIAQPYFGEVADSEPHYGEPSHAQPAIASEAADEHAPPVAAEEPHPDHATVSAREAEPEMPATSPVIGRYESEGTSYVMYADGSIDAQSSAGVYRFASMAELKAFIES